MKIVTILHVEDCLDGSVVKELVLSQAIDEAFIQHFGRWGQLAYYPHFAKPFFKLTLAGKLSMKGVQGNTTLRVRFTPPFQEHLQWLQEAMP